MIAEAVRAGKQRSMPEGEDRGTGYFDADVRAWCGDVAVTKRGPKHADDERGERRDNGEQKSLLARESVHEDEFRRASLQVSRLLGQFVQVPGETKREDHERQRRELWRAIGEDSSGGNEEILNPVHAQVRIYDTGVWIRTHAGAAHCMSRVVDVGDGSCEIELQQRGIPFETGEG